MDTVKAQRIDRLAGQLAEILMAAAICAKELRTEVRDEIEEGHLAPGAAAESDVKRIGRPLMSESTLSVLWNGRSLHLGHTIYFRLLERLARRPNQYITHLDLLREVWDDEELATSTIRSVVRHLRRRLHNGGMGDLAESIRGHNGRYIMEL
jgi:DNA-binding response OmpR family regulator